MRAVSITYGHALPNHAGNPLRSRHERKHKADPVQSRPEFNGARHVWIGNPDVNVYIVVQWIG